MLMQKEKIIRIEFQIIIAIQKNGNFNYLFINF